MPLDLRRDVKDGQTRELTTDPVDADGNAIPVITVAYRPALPDALYDWRWKGRMAQSGKGELDANAEFAASHLVRWDVSDGGQPARITPQTVRALPEPVLNQLVKAIATWGTRPKPEEPSPAEQDEKNSVTG